MTYEEALHYLESFVNYERTADWPYPEAFKLERMRALVKELGNPQNAFESVIIAGSKGKGSTAAILSSVLRMENYRVGLYTSPHLVDVRERMRVNGLLMSVQRFTESVERLMAVLDTPDWRRNPPTYFEFLTAMAFEHFREMKVEIAVLETGLGGLYDSTNIMPARVVGFSPISLEHTDKLGKTISKIAVQKAGIIKGRELVVSAPQVEEAEAVIRRAADERDAELWRVGHEIKVIERDFGEDFQRFDVRTPLGNYFDLELRLLGRHQIDNAALAVGLAAALGKECYFKLSEIAVKRGVLDAWWPGRLEKVLDWPLVVLDGAQNPESARRLVEGLKRHFQFRRLVAVMGMSADKDAKGILGEILPETSIFIATQATSPRALAAPAIAAAAEGFNGEKFVEPDFSAAFEKAKSLSRENDLILVGGSLFLVGDMKKHFEKEFRGRGHARF